MDKAAAKMNLGPIEFTRACYHGYAIPYLFQLEITSALILN